MTDPTQSDRPDLPEIVGAQQLSEWAGIPKSTLHNWRYLGKGPRSFKVGRHIRYLRSDVEAWLDGLRKADPSSSSTTP